MAKKGKILIITKTDYLTKNSGSTAYLKSIIQGLKKENKVEVLNMYKIEKIFFFDKEGINYFNNAFKIGKLHFCYGVLLRRILFSLQYILNNNFFLNFLPKYTPALQPFDKKEINFVINHIKKKKYTTVIANYISSSNVFKENFFKEKNIKTIILTCDIIQNRIKIFKEKGINCQNIAHWTEEKEIEAWQSADIIVSIQKEETQQIQQLCPNKKIITTPVSFDLKMTSKKRLEREFQKNIMFIGANNPPNKSAVEFLLSFASEINATFNIYGGVCKEFKKQNQKNVVFKGKLDNLQEAYQNNDIALVPLIGGTGLKVKSVEALSYSMPIVGTKYAIEGMRNSLGKCCFEGNSEKELINELKNLINNEELYKKATKEAQKYFENNFTPKIALKELIETLKEK
ncbi:MAG: glycosyltransferase family 4 protein [Candidatus Gastranaerophilales bacterium]|nr:glycosyltransferase family 4 protein [Candidatus Gastranaerophilales bacterium]